MFTTNVLILYDVSFCRKKQPYRERIGIRFLQFIKILQTRTLLFQHNYGPNKKLKLGFNDKAFFI